MAPEQSALLDLLGELKLTDVTDRIRVATETLYQELIDAEATAFIGAAPFERSGDRTTHRNGTRPRTLTTTAGDLDLKIPKLRAGSFFPALLERRRRVVEASDCSEKRTRGRLIAGGHGRGNELTQTWAQPCVPEHEGGRRCVQQVAEKRIPAPAAIEFSPQPRVRALPANNAIRTLDGSGLEDGFTSHERPRSENVVGTQRNCTGVRRGV